MRAESYRPRGAIAMARANTGKGRSRIEKELLDCWSEEQKSGQRGAKRQRDAQQAQSSSTRNNDSEEETSRANEAADRHQYPEKFAKWDKEAKRGTAWQEARHWQAQGRQRSQAKQEGRGIAVTSRQNGKNVGTSSWDVRQQQHPLPSSSSCISKTHWQVTQGREGQGRLSSGKESFALPSAA